MKKIILATVLFSTILMATPNQAVTKLSDETRNLFKAEMSFIKTGMDEILYAMISGDDEKVQEIAGEIRDSFIFTKSLKPHNVEEIKKLPKQFFTYDAELHGGASDLANAAEFNDKEEMKANYFKMVNSCTKCHATFATHRFTKFLEEE